MIRARGPATKGGSKLDNRGKSKLALASAIAGLMSLAAAPGVAFAESGEKVNCYGVNKCKGKGYLKIDAETCLKIQGGRLTAEPEKG